MESKIGKFLKKSTFMVLEKLHIYRSKSTGKDFFKISLSNSSKKYFKTPGKKY